MASPLDQITSSPQFKPFMKKLALMAVALTLVALVLKLRGLQQGNTLLIIGMGTLSIVALFLGRLFPCPDERGRGLWKFAMLLTGISLAVAIMGLLFKIMHWPGGIDNLIVGIVGLTISAIGWFLYFRTRKNIYEEIKKED